MTDLKGSCLLVVEDDELMGLLMVDLLSSEGADVVGPFTTVEAARVAAEEEPIHGAMLDVNLLDGVSYPVAETLEARGIPYAFFSASRRESVPADLHPVDFLSKPAGRLAVLAVCERVIEAG